MGDSLEQSPSPNTASYSELFESVEGFYISIGMSYDDFWRDDPRKTIAYRKAHALEADRKNAEAWRAGMYTLSAMQSVIANALAKKGSPPVTYLQEPLPLTQEEVAKRAERDALAAEQRVIKAFEKWAKEGG